jgi:hypothetical protein
MTLCRGLLPGCSCNSCGWTHGYSLLSSGFHGYSSLLSSGFLMSAGPLEAEWCCALCGSVQVLAFLKELSTDQKIALHPVFIRWAKELGIQASMFEVGAK